MAAEFKLTASPAVAVEDFGNSVAISGDYAIIGARNDGFDPGSAYVFKRVGTGWTQQVKLNASDKQGLDHFGASVSIHGDYAVVGAPNAGLFQGSAYIFHRSGSAWAEQAKIKGNDIADFGYFGRSVAISGDYVIAGADKAAYIFHRVGSSWSQQAKLTPPGTINNNFGVSVSLSGPYAIVGDTGGSFMGPDKGAAYIFRRSGTSWAAQTQPLIANDAVTYDFFGWSVSISGDHAIVGAPGAISYGETYTAGAAYMFERSGSNWLRTAKLVPLNPLTLKEFGRSVAIVGNYALVGDPGDYDTAPGGGAAYLFRRNGLSWTMVEPKIVASDVAGSDWFGQSVALSGTDILVGAPNATDTEIHQGIAYVYPIPVHMEPQKEFSIYARILFGLIMGGPGVILLPGSGPVPVDPEPYRRAWTALSAPERDLFVGLALGEVASLIHDADVRQQVKEAGLDLTRSAARRLSKART